jgi:hypothetical protein
MDSRRITLADVANINRCVAQDPLYVSVAN